MLSQSGNWWRRSDAMGHERPIPPFRAMSVPPPNATRIATAAQLGGRNESPSMSAIAQLRTIRVAREITRWANTDQSAPQQKQRST
jgi:hypothetical protein